MLHFGYEVWIADGRKEPLPEYDVKLEGEDGKTMVFQVRWKDYNGPAANHKTMRVYLDGHAAGKTNCPPGSSGKRLGIRTASADTYQPYQFSDLQTTDEDGALWAAEKLGLIELHVVYVHPYAEKAAFRPARFAGTASVHERSKKAGAHCVALGKAVRMPKGLHERVKSTPLDSNASPAAKFVFRYRPAGLLVHSNPPGAGPNALER
uniref:AAA_12 domain-containing protein n=1 Tax=Ganoderma boninense TaxID=34458 RepID=A0A5K1JUA1_9APHY|nr:AAA_12 domain-containing protein [Ganoderma boninense]